MFNSDDDDDDDDEECHELGRQVFLDVFKTNVSRRATFHLDKLLSLLLGQDNIANLILEQGHTPQMIEKAFPNADQLRLTAFPQMTEAIVRSALGFTVWQCQGLFDTSSDGASLNDFRAGSVLSDRIGPLSSIDHAPLFAVIEAERTNGSLSDDPAWHDEFRSRRVKKKKVDWRTYMTQMLEDLEKNFAITASEFDWFATIAAQTTAEKIKVANVKMLKTAVRRQIDQPFRPTQGPSKLDESAPHQHDEDDKAQRLGQSFLRKLLVWFDTSDDSSTSIEEKKKT